MTPDPKWLEILKASGWQTSALGAAFGTILLLMHVHWLVSPDPWFSAFCTRLSLYLRALQSQTSVMPLQIF